MKKNGYKANKLNFRLFLILCLLGFVWTLSSIDTARLIQTEIQQFHASYKSFSSTNQIIDSGDGSTLSDIKLAEFIPLFKRIGLIIYEGILGEENQELKEINVFIKFKHLEKIYNDRSRAISKDVNINPREVPCKISDGINAFKCELRLKGDLSPHWLTKTRMSLRVKVKGGYIHGMKDFSIQKPSARQFPYDQTFQYINSKMGRLSSNMQDFVNVTLNGEEWGVMNIEPSIDDRFIEVQGLKRLGVFRISNQDSWAYEKQKGQYEGYFISHPTVNLSQRGKESEILKDRHALEIFSFISNGLSSKSGSLFDRDIMLGNLILAMTWGNTHSLLNNNSWYTWNPYSQKLEPILTDQVSWQNASEYLDKLDELPFEYKLMLQSSPITDEEFAMEIKKLRTYFESNDPRDHVNLLKHKYFRNDSLFTETVIYENLKYLEAQASNVVAKINQLASKRVRKEPSSSEISASQIDMIDNYVKVLHLTNGLVRVYNLMDVDIKIERLSSNKEVIDINQVLSASSADTLSYLDISSNFIGDYSNLISVTGSLQGIEKNTRNNLSLLDLSSLYQSYESQDSDKLCDSYLEGNICVISSNKNFYGPVYYNAKTIINSGVQIFLDKGADVIFESSVLMYGDSDSPIKILGNKTGGIFIKNDKGEKSIIKNVVFTNLATTTSLLRKYTGSINGYGGVFEIENVIINGGKSEDQLNIINSRVDVLNLQIFDAPSDAFDCDFCNGDVRNLSLYNIEGDGLDVSGSNLNIYSLFSENISDKALSVGEKSNINLDGAIFKNVATGVAVKDSSKASIQNIILENIEFNPFMTYVKKPFYKGSTVLNASKVTDDKKNKGLFCVREDNTNLVVDGIECEISEINVDDLYQGRMKK